MLQYKVILGDVTDPCYGYEMGTWKGKKLPEEKQKITIPAGAFTVMSVNTEQQKILVKMSK